MKRILPVLAVALFSHFAQASFLGPEATAIVKFLGSSTVQQAIEQELESGGLKKGEVTAALVHQSRHFSKTEGPVTRSLYLVRQQIVDGSGGYHPYSRSVVGGVTVTSALAYNIASEPKVVNQGEFHLTAIYSGIVTDKTDSETLQSAFLRAHQLAGSEEISELEARGYRIEESKTHVLSQVSGFAGYSELSLVTTKLVHPSFRVPAEVVTGIYTKDPAQQSVRGQVYASEDLRQLLSYEK